ncbi:MAG: Zn-ribbon domain-containing OB-fold protein [Novosphingobium sp.]|nr:Zn-ribbon domain-containing OB-fold protein [Novosphingobium sp.]
MSLPVPDIDDVNRLYFEGTASGELRIRHCKRCESLFRFAHAWCPDCWSQDLDYKLASGRGKVETFTVVHQAPYESFEDRIPYVIALVELEEGVRMMSNIVDCEPDRVEIGLPVKVAYEQRGPVMLPMFTPDV